MLLTQKKETVRGDAKWTLNERKRVFIVYTYAYILIYFLFSEWSLDGSRNILTHLIQLDLRDEKWKTLKVDLISSKVSNLLIVFFFFLLF